MKRRARDMRYYKNTRFAKERPSAPTRKSLARCFFGPFFLFVSEREDGSPWANRGLLPSLPYRAVERRARVTRPKVSGRVSLSPARTPAVRARARATRASALRGPRGPYPLGIYPDFYIADKVLATLGEGTFGKVVKVKDLQM